jgi:hypothetical protein
MASSEKMAETRSFPPFHFLECTELSSGRLELLLDQKKPFLFLDGVLKFFWSSPYDRGLSRQERSLSFGMKDAL